MATTRAAGEELQPQTTPQGKRLWRHAVLTPGLLAVGLMLLWAEHDGGYDADTWYWGALLLLALLVATLLGLEARRTKLSRSAVIALGAFSAYAAWSYLSIAWAATPGSALEGSNRTLLYLLLFTLFLILPWTTEAAVGALLLFVLGVGAIGVVILVRLAVGHDLQQLVIEGRMVAPTGYFNSSVALFMIAAVLGVALAVRRELPTLLRGGLIAASGAALELCVMGQSRGWLFTLPLVLVVATVVVRDRMRFAVAALIPILATLVPIHLLLDLFTDHRGLALQQSAARAGRAGLIACAAALVVGTAIAWSEARIRGPRWPTGVRRALGITVASLAVAGACAGAIVATHGHAWSFVSRQWRGFSHVQSGAHTSSHFGAVGSGRYDFWRVSIDALRAHPVGGLGQDNFADYYVAHGLTGEEPSAPHSLEMSLLAETGVVGFGLFLVFLVAAIAAALRARQAGSELTRAIAAAALLPLAVWLVHGSVDWFWEMPGLSAPPLAFLGLAGALARPSHAVVPDASVRTGVRRAMALVLGAMLMAAALVALGFSYVSVREVSLANDVRQTDPSLALKDLTIASELNPLSADPGRIGGTIALQTGRYMQAQRRFTQATTRDPGGWFAWLGRGLADSALGYRRRARQDLAVAYRINPHQPVVRLALERVSSRRPLAPAAALRQLVLVQ
jgi:O-Antigen ligase